MLGKADPMRVTLLATVKEIKRQQEHGESSAEQAQRDADNAVLAYIDDANVISLCAQIRRWHA
jgi:hypothetical protein